jgi:hypothetical protein
MIHRIKNTGNARLYRVLKNNSNVMDEETEVEKVRVTGPNM